jgi:hypothetical protein
MWKKIATKICSLSAAAGIRANRYKAYPKFIKMSKKESLVCF